MNRYQADIQPETLKADVLIVDDSADNLRVLSTTLTQQGYTVRCVKSGAMALLAVQTAPPNLILLDIRMPGMDGYEVCQRLKADAATQSIPVIFLSAIGEVLDKVKAFALGGADYITKPFQIEEVLARVENQLAIQTLQNQLIEKNFRLQQEIQEHERTEAALRQEIYHRTLAETALRDAKAAAEAASSAKSEFLARMSHELRTPLNAVLGFTQVMQTDTSFSEKHQRHLAIVHQSGKHLLNLVNNILTMTRIEAGNVSLHETQFDLFHLLESLQQIWQGRAIAKRLAFTVEWGPEVPQYIRSDESKLRQILMNLLENAIRFTTEGEVVLRVWGEGKIGNRWHTANAATAASNVPRPYLLQFEVSDTGPCIAPSEIGRLFEAFSQPASEPKSAQGIGLGLPISRQFVQLMGGEMYVRSRPGQGTSFSFDIKVQLVEPAVTDPAIAAQPSHEAGLPEAIAISYLVPPPLTAEQLRAAMPSDWIDHLHQAALRGSDQAILDLIQAIPAKQTDLAEALLIWTDTFRFDEIIQLTQQLIK